MGTKSLLRDDVLRLPGGQSGVFVVIKSRAVKLVFAALGGNADIGDSRVFGAEIIGKNIDFADRFERRLAACVGEPKIVLVDRWPSR